MLEDVFQQSHCEPVDLPNHRLSRSQKYTNIVNDHLELYQRLADVFHRVHEFLEDR